jgi:Uma2 family endonuclease
MASQVTTADELLRMGDIGRCELLRGKLVMMNPTGHEHGRVTLNLGAPIRNHVLAHGLGKAYAAETGFLLSREPDTVRAPDVGFVRAGREAPTSRGFFPGAPDLAVEVLSPDDRPRYVREKVAEWLAAGTRAVWVVDPRRRTVVLHEPGAEPRLLHETDMLRGGDLIPGFEVEVSEVFA